MDERKDSPITVAIQVIAASSPLWMIWAIALVLYVGGDDAAQPFVAAGNFVIGAIGVWSLARWINRRPKRPPDAP